MLRLPAAQHVGGHEGRAASAGSRASPAVPRASQRTRPAASSATATTSALERVFVYCLCWSVGALLEADDRMKFDTWLRRRDGSKRIMPRVQEGETVYEYYVDSSTGEWQPWKPPQWTYPGGDKLDFSNLLVPTMDSTRARTSSGPSTARRDPSSWSAPRGRRRRRPRSCSWPSMDPGTMLTKRSTSRRATTPGMAQYSIEAELDKRGGKNFGPPNGKKMTIFFDDVSMPEVNKWGDQTTLELVRQLVEHGGFCFLDKDKRGDFKTCEDLQYLAAMQHPGGGKNDIPNRLKRKFFIFNMVLPQHHERSTTSTARCSTGASRDGTSTGTRSRSSAKLTNATIQLWRVMKARMLPTPAKFHYVFNMRDLSRVFQGILCTPKAVDPDGRPARDGGQARERLARAHAARPVASRVRPRLQRQARDDQGQGRATTASSASSADDVFGATCYEQAMRLSEVHGQLPARRRVRRGRDTRRGGPQGVRARRDARR